MAFANTQQTIEEQYLALDAASDEKLELHNGEIVAMAGAKRNHVRITDNISGLFYVRLKGSGCTYYSQDMRVRISEETYYYPDVVVVCGEELIVDELDLYNPTVIIEVLSDSTKSTDSSEKTANYRQLPSLQAYLLVSTTGALVTLSTRNGDSWTLRDIIGLQNQVTIESLGLSLALADIYENVDFAKNKAKQIKRPKR
jgi:Uma2 family endonuclease